MRYVTLLSLEYFNVVKMSDFPNVDCRLFFAGDRNVSSPPCKDKPANRRRKDGNEINGFRLIFQSNMEQGDDKHNIAGTTVGKFRCNKAEPCEALRKFLERFKKRG